MNKHFKNLASLKIQMSRIFSNTQSIKTVIALCVFICVSFNLWAQSTNPNPKRSVLFTLGVNEVIYKNEYFVSQKLNQNRFTCIVCDTLKNRNTFVFNGKRVATADDGGWCCWFDFKYLNVNEENGYIFSYWKAGKNYVNCKGFVSGVFVCYCCT